MNIYCTLFDSNYMDKGLALYDSLCQCEESFRLYVFTFDDLSRDILRKEALEHIVVVPLEDFESDALLAVKPTRSRAEYCWTCTPWTIKYVLEHYQEPICTYIDADMMFFHSPSYVFENMRAAGCSTIIVPHRLAKDPKSQRREEHAGKYCVEFNTFVNNEDGRRILDWWADACLDWCYYVRPNTGETRFGDQKYLEEFAQRFSGVYVCEDVGVGMANWNAGQAKLVPGTQAPYQVEEIATGKRSPLVFFHFASVAHLSKKWVNINSGIKDKALHDVACEPYIALIREKREYLRKEYGLELYVLRKVTNNVLMAFYQSYIARWIHVRRLSDLYKI